jgi:hypothetical protein
MKVTTTYSNQVFVASKGAQAIHAAGDRAAFLNPVVRYVFFSMLEKPLLQIYLFGPSFGVYGFWQGMPPSHICASMTNVHTPHWDENQDECAMLIFNRFESYMVVCYGLMYIYMAFRLAVTAGDMIRRTCYSCTRQTSVIAK